MHKVLSVVIPVYGTEKYLSECLESLSGLSSFKKLVEVVVVSDASPGNTENILLKFEKNFPIKFLKHSENLSVFQARKTGIEASSGRYILSLDSDDTLSSMNWETLMELLEKDAVDFLRYSIASEGTDCGKMQVCELKGTEVWDFLISRKLWQLAGTIVRRSLFEEIFKQLKNYPNSLYINMGDDLCYTALLSNIAKNYHERLGLGHYCYRINPTSITRTHFGKTKVEVLRISNDYINCKSLVYSLIEDKKKQADFQKLLDSNIPWIISKVYKCLYSYPELWNIFRDIFSENSFFDYLLEFDLRTSSSVVSMLLPKTQSPVEVKNIGVIVTKLQGGGTERMACSLASLLSEHFKVHLFTSFKSNNDFNVSSEVVIHLIANDTKRRHKILDICLKKGINTVILVDYYLDKTLKDILFFKFYGLNVIAQEHNSFAAPLYTGQIALMANRTDVYKNCDLLTCLNHSDLLFWQTLGITHVSYIPNILSITPSFKFKTLPNGPKKVLYLGRLNNLKGVNDLLEIICNVCMQTEDVIFEICGSFTDPIQEQFFKNQIAKLIIKNRVIFSGYIQNIEKKLNGANLLILPSYVEGSPMVIGEARAKGLPVLMYNLPYVDIVQNGVVTSPRGDPIVFSDNLIKLISCPEEYKKLSQDCFNGLEHWSPALVKKIWLKNIKELHRIKEPYRDPTISHLISQFQLAIDYLYENKNNPLEDKDLLRKVRRYDKLLNLFNKYFPSGSWRRRALKVTFSKLSHKL